VSRAYRSALVVFILGIVAASACGRGKPDSDDVPKPTNAGAKAPSRTSAGDPIVRLDPAAQARIGVQTQVVAAQTMQPEVAAFGRLEADPSRSFVLRAPVSGTLHFAEGREWPRIGQLLEDGATVGALEPRLGPAERIALTNQLASARADLSASTSSVVAAKAAYERARLLNADNKNVSDRALEDATSRLASEESKVRTATETVRLLEDSLRSAAPSGTTALKVERGGEVIELMAQPGEAVEPSTAILRVTKFDRLLARVDVPVGEHIPPTVSTARIMAVGYENDPIVAERAGLAATAEPAAQGQSFLFRLTATRFGLRPGLAVTARIPVPGPKGVGVLIPTTAVVRVSGKAYAFTQTSGNEFVRKELTLDQPVEGGFVAPTNFAPGDRVVVQGAQLLLSEEFKSQLAAESEKG